MEEKSKLLKSAITKAKNRDIRGFEELYFLTCEQTFKDVYSLVGDEEYSWNILKKVYIQIYSRLPDVPVVGTLDTWIHSIVLQETGEKKELVNEEQIPAQKKFADLENKATNCLIEIEGILDILDENNSETTTKDVVFSISKIIGAAAFAILAVVILIFAYHFMKNRVDGVVDELPSIGIASASEAENVAESVAETKVSEEKKPGWISSQGGRKYVQPDLTYAKQTWIRYAGKMYYVDKNEVMVTGQKEIKGQIYNFDDEGALYGIVRGYVTEDGDNQLTRRLKEIGREEDLPEVVKDSLVVENGWIYYLMKEETSGYPRLLRLSTKEDQLELLESNVAGFFIFDGMIYYEYENEIRMRSADLAGEPLKTAMEAAVQMSSGIYLAVEDDGFYMVNDVGSAITDNGGYVQIDGRIYRVADGRIKYVKPVNAKTQGVTFYLNGDTLDNHIYWQADSGSQGVLVEDGIFIRSFCLVGNWIYYNACIGQEGGVYYSVINRVSVDGLTKEEVQGQFSGIIQNMYYYGNLGRIFMEYEPYIKNSTYGNIVVMGLGGGINPVDDSAIRATRTVSGNDQMELIMADESNLYCYWHECSYDRESGALSAVWTIPVVIPY